MPLFDSINSFALVGIVVNIAFLLICAGVCLVRKLRKVAANGTQRDKPVFRADHGEQDAPLIIEVVRTDT